MRLNTIGPKSGSRPKRTRVGRGAGSGLGKTCGRGVKGQTSRSGGNIRAGFEGGQMPLQRRIPKRGFNSHINTITAEIRLSDIEKMQTETVDFNALREAGVIGNAIKRAKIIKAGELSRKVKVVGLRVTKGAKAAIEAVGGSIEG